MMDPALIILHIGRNSPLLQQFDEVVMTAAVGIMHRSPLLFRPDHRIGTVIEQADLSHNSLSELCVDTVISTANHKSVWIRTVYVPATV